MILDALLEMRAEKINPVHPRDPVLAQWFGGRDTLSGVKVTEATAMTFSAVYDAVRIISETIASLPLFPFMRAGDSRSIATEHPSFFMLNREPNPTMTRFKFWETAMGHILTWGNAYAELVRDAGGTSQRCGLSLRLGCGRSGSTIRSCTTSRQTPAR